MQGTWGRRVFGTVQRGPKFTRFRLEIKLDNGCTIYTVRILANDQLDGQPRIYGWTLDQMVDYLQDRINKRSQVWAQG